MEVGSREVCKAAIQIALTDSREEEIEMKAKNKENGILSVAVDFGSDFGSAVPKVLERAVVAANVKMLYLQPMRKKVRLPVRHMRQFSRLSISASDLISAVKSVLQDTVHISVYAYFLLSVY